MYLLPAIFAGCVVVIMDIFIRQTILVPFFEQDVPEVCKQHYDGQTISLFLIGVITYYMVDRHLIPSSR